MQERLELHTAKKQRPRTNETFWRLLKTSLRNANVFLLRLLDAWTPSTQTRGGSSSSHVISEPEGRLWIEWKSSTAAGTVLSREAHHHKATCWWVHLWGSRTATGEANGKQLNVMKENIQAENGLIFYKFEKVQTIQYQKGEEPACSAWQS